MPAITLPDGSVRTFDAPVAGTTVAAAIGPGLARAARAGWQLADRDPRSRVGGPDRGEGCSGAGLGP